MVFDMNDKTKLTQIVTVIIMAIPVLIFANAIMAANDGTAYIEPAFELASADREITIIAEEPTSVVGDYTMPTETGPTEPVIEYSRQSVIDYLIGNEPAEESSIAAVAYFATAVETTSEAIPEAEPDAEWISIGTYTILHYCLCPRCCGIWSAQHQIRENDPDYIHLTASGVEPVAGVTAAVNPDIIPFGSTIYIDGIGEYTAQDTGAVPKRSRVIDLLVEDHETALEFGRKQAEVWVRVE